jgi:tetratricopeptide (TPR) repeat protein
MAYRASKFARRYRVALVTACAFALVLIAAAVVSIRQSIRANQEAAVAQAVNDFLQNDVLAQASAANQSGPSAKPDPDLKVRTALDRAAQRITGKFDQQPELEASIRETIGQTYTDLGLYPEARAQLERALELDRRVFGEKDQKTLKAMTYVGRIAARQGRYAEAEKLLNQVLQTQQKVLGAKHPDTLDTMYFLAGDYNSQGKYAQGEALDSQVLEIRRRVLGPEHPSTLNAKYGLGDDYLYQGKYAQAEALFTQVVEAQRRVLGPEHPSTLNSMNDLARDYDRQGKFAQAEALYLQIWEIRRRVLGPEHPETLMSMHNLGYAYYEQGKYAQAEALLSQALEVQRRVLGPTHPDTVRSVANLALDYQAQGKQAELDALRRTALASSPNDAHLLNVFAWDLVAVADPRQRRPAEALPFARRLVQLAPDSGDNYNTLGLVDYRNDHWTEAISALNRAVELHKDADPTDLLFLAMAHWRRGDKREAEQFFQRGVEAASKKETINPELKMFWSEAAGVLGKPGPPAVTH